MCTRPRQHRRARRRNAGLSMIELIMFIVVVSIGVVGILRVLNVAVQTSADPMRRKQAIAIAESVLTTIEQQQFTFCDPLDPAMSTALSTAGCTTSQDGAGGANGSTVAGPMPMASAFNNVADYGNWAPATITDITGGNAMNGYVVTVAITRAGGDAQFAPTVGPDDALRIQVTVRFGTEPAIVLVGYRFRYSPNGNG